MCALAQQMEADKARKEQERLANKTLPAGMFPDNSTRPRQMPEYYGAYTSPTRQQGPNVGASGAQDFRPEPAV
jgi:hypothetical protein